MLNGNDCSPGEIETQRPASTNGAQYASGGAPGMVMAATAKEESATAASEVGTVNQPDLMMIQLSSFEGRADQ